MSGSYGLVFVVASIFGGEALLSSALGADYAPAAPLMSLLLLSATVELVVFMLRTGGYAMGLADKVLWLHLISAVLYLTAFVTLTPRLGLIGPGIAAIFSSTVTLIGISILIYKGIQKATPLSAQTHE
jgi:O-antigen/teichoic acid export membrane protein